MSNSFPIRCLLNRRRGPCEIAPELQRPLRAPKKATPLVGIRERRDLERHPKLGASWEGFALEAVVRRLGVEWRDCYFWGTHAGAELDLLVVRGRKRWGFEVKRTSAPTVTKSMRMALDDLRLQQLDVVHGGLHTFRLAPRISALALSRLLEDLRPLS